MNSIKAFLHLFGSLDESKSAQHDVNSILCACEIFFCDVLIAYASHSLVETGAKPGAHRMIGIKFTLANADLQRDGDVSVPISMSVVERRFPSL